MASAPPGLNFKVSLSEDEPEQPCKSATISDSHGWDDAFTLMMLYERVLGKRPGAVNCFDAPQEPPMTLDSEQREVVAVTCQQLLFGFAPRSAAEHASPNKDLSKLISNMQQAVEYRARFHDEREWLSEKAPCRNKLNLFP